MVGQRVTPRNNKQAVDRKVDGDDFRVICTFDQHRSYDTLAGTDHHTLGSLIFKLRTFLSAKVQLLPIGPFRLSTHPGIGTA